MTRAISVRPIILHEGKLLCVRLKAYERAVKGDFWCLPGGGVDDNEALIPALEREIIEELGVKAQVGRLLYVQQFRHGDKDILEFFFHVTNPQDFLDIDLSKTSHGQEEIAEIAFVDPKTTYILPRFLSTEPLEQKINTADAVQIFSYPPSE